MTRKYEISERSIMFAVLFPLFLWFLWVMKELLFSLLIAFIFMSALRPIALWLEKKKVPRTTSIVIVFLGFILTFVTLASLIIPPIVTETTSLVRNLPAYVSELPPEVSQYVDLGAVTQYVPTITNNIFAVIGSLLSNFIFVLTILFFTLFFLLEKDIVRRVLSPFLPDAQLDHYVGVVEKVEKRLTAWFWGQITLMTVIGSITFIVLSLLGIRYAFPLAVFAGLLEVVPNLGPIIASLPAILVAFAEAPILGGVVLVAYFIIQQLENILIVPYIMSRAANVSPILTLISLYIGGQIGGVLGVLLSIPLLIIVQTIVLEIWVDRSKKKKLQVEKL